MCMSYMSMFAVVDNIQVRYREGVRYDVDVVAVNGAGASAGVCVVHCEANGYDVVGD